MVVVTVMPCGVEYWSVRMMLPAGADFIRIALGAAHEMRANPAPSLLAWSRGFVQILPDRKPPAPVALHCYHATPSCDRRVHACGRTGLRSGGAAPRG